MRVDPRFLGWGVFLILLGAIPLAVDQGWLRADDVAGWWRYWPLILIGIGVGFLLRRTAVQFVGGLIVAATLGLMFGSLLGGGVDGRFGFACAAGGNGTPFASQSGSFGTSGRVSLEMNCGEANVTAAPGSGWTLAGTGPGGHAPSVDSGGERLEIRSPDRGWFAPIGPDAGRETWALTLPTDPTLSLAATLNAGTARFGLAGANLSSLSMTTNAGSATIDLGAATVGSLSHTLNAGSTKITLPAGGTTGSVTVNAGSLDLCAPAGAGLRIVANDNVLASTNFATQGLTRTGSTWTTPGFASAPVKIELSITANLGSVTLNPGGGCQ